MHDRDLKSNAGDFRNGIQYFGLAWEGFETLGKDAVIAEGRSAITDPRAPACAYQTLLAADALRYLAMQLVCSKRSGHAGGFASIAEAHAALWMLGHKNIVTDLGHHAPGFYGALFLDRSLERVGISSVVQLVARFRERAGLLGHLSGAIPGVVSPAGPLGQGQHFAMAGALLHPRTLFPVTLGDGALAQPYIMSAIHNFGTCYPEVTNFLPILVWNGYGQEHRAIVSGFSNDQMKQWWEAHGFRHVVLVDAHDFAPPGLGGVFADSTTYALSARMAYASSILTSLSEAASSALSGVLTVVIIKQLKGAGIYATGARSHNATEHDGISEPHVVDALVRRAVPADGWRVVRDNFQRAGGGPAAEVLATNSRKSNDEYQKSSVPLCGAELGAMLSPSACIATQIAHLGRADSRLIVASADGTTASGMGIISGELGIRFPTDDRTSFEHRAGQVYEPLSEDACAGLVSGLTVLGSPAIWLSYESFAVNGLPVVQSALQAMAELPWRTPPLIAIFAPGPLEQGRNGWTHQRPEIQNYLGAMLRSGNVYPLFPVDGNTAQAAFEFSVSLSNSGAFIFASRRQVQVRTSLDSARCGLAKGALVLYESALRGRVLVLALLGDGATASSFTAARTLEMMGWRVRIVAVLNPRRLYRASEISVGPSVSSDACFLLEEEFNALFDADTLIAITAGAGGLFEPVLLHARAQRRCLLTWKRGETTGSSEELLERNGLTADDIVACVGTAQQSVSGR